VLGSERSLDGGGRFLSRGNAKEPLLKGCWGGGLDDIWETPLFKTDGQQKIACHLKYCVVVIHRACFSWAM
jgi:hypothetical protein